MCSKGLCNMQVRAQDVCVLVVVVGVTPFNILLPEGHQVSLSGCLAYCDPKVSENRGNH